MSAVILLCLIVVSVGVGAYYFLGGPSGSSSSFKSYTSEAEALVKKEFEKHFTRCGDSYFGDKVPWGLVQFKNVTFQVKQLNLTEADRLNATEWKGIASINCDLTRLYDGMAHKWSDWTSKNPLLNPNGNIASYALEKRQGEWRGIDFGPPSSQKKRSCEEIPGEKLTKAQEAEAASQRAKREAESRESTRTIGEYEIWADKRSRSRADWTKGMVKLTDTDVVFSPNAVQANVWFGLIKSMEVRNDIDSISGGTNFYVAINFKNLQNGYYGASLSFEDAAGRDFFFGDLQSAVHAWRERFRDLQ